MKHNCSMTVLLRCRVDKPILKKADRVTRKLGTSTGEMVRIFLAEIARTGKVPLSLDSSEKSAETIPWETRAPMIESFYDKSKTW